MLPQQCEVEKGRMASHLAIPNLGELAVRWITMFGFLSNNDGLLTFPDSANMFTAQYSSENVHQLHPVSAVVEVQVDAQLVDSTSWERKQSYASISLDANGNTRTYNALASDLLAEQTVMKVQNGRLVPFLAADLPLWIRCLNKILDDRQASILILQAEHHRVAVALVPNNQGVEVRIQRNDTVEDETLRIFAHSAGITAAERDVLRLVTSGLKPAIIAKVRCRSEATVRSHIKSLLYKTGCTSIQELVSLVAALPPMA